MVGLAIGIMEEGSLVTCQMKAGKMWIQTRMRMVAVTAVLWQLPVLSVGASMLGALSRLGWTQQVKMNRCVRIYFICLVFLKFIQPQPENKDTEEEWELEMPADVYDESPDLKTLQVATAGNSTANYHAKHTERSKYFAFLSNSEGRSFWTELRVKAPEDVNKWCDFETTSRPHHILMLDLKTQLSASRTGVPPTNPPFNARIHCVLPHTHRPSLPDLQFSIQETRYPRNANVDRDIH
jgi:hypothetical protein